MRNLFKEFDWVKVFIYFVSALFLSYLIFICFFAKPDQFLFGNVFINPKEIDFGGFGSLLAGVFSPLAFLWLILNFRQQDKNLKIAEKQLSILLEEKRNRRNLLKASIKVLSYGIESYSEKDNKLCVKFSYISNFDLHKSCIYGLDMNSAISLKPCRNTDIIFMSQKEQYVPKEQEISTILYIDLSKINKGALNSWTVHLKYLDSDGYEQKSNFSVFLSPKSLNSFELLTSGFVVMAK